VGRDVRNGFVSVRAAADDYGVALDADTLEVDEGATTALRAVRGA
jgi:N-methylhydantoinase B